MAAAGGALLAAAFGAAAQESETEIPSHSAPAPAPVSAASELDALNRSEEEAFPDFDVKQMRRPVSVTVRALDKITARTKDLEVRMDETARFGSLEILPRSCDKRPPEDFPETTAFLEVFDRDNSRARAGAAVEARDLSAKPRRRADGALVAPVAPAPATDAAGDLPSALDPDRIFSGWMFASTPALNALEHPVYDVWVIDCKTVVVDN
jgi:hypothetical protein